MSYPLEDRPHEPPDLGPHADEASSTERQLVRFDLTGHTVREWTVRAREGLTGLLRQVFKSVAATQIPNTEKTVGDKAREVPQRIIEHAEGRLEEIPVKNALNKALTDKAFAEAEAEAIRADLLREQTRKTAAEAEGQEIQNERERIKLEKERRQAVVEEELIELTRGRPMPRVMGLGGEEIVVVADVPLLEHSASPASMPMLEQLRLSGPTRSSLRRTGIAKVEQLLTRTPAELRAINRIGPKRLVEIRTALAEFGLRLRG
ncbi:MAG: hypothetical protein A2V70_05035 [Planctomycetes bacterium RBG_13_63_9]|nr:MAG: hypothetical protein A2V70_05035 [Planctomycetes bacterium RBG_13_63_9]